MRLKAWRIALHTGPTLVDAMALRLLEAMQYDVVRGTETVYCTYYAPDGQQAAYGVLGELRRRFGSTFGLTARAVREMETCACCGLAEPLQTLRKREPEAVTE